MSKNGWQRWLRETAREFGALVEHTRGGHLVVIHPNGWRVYAPSTPGDHRAMKNTRRDIVRAADTKGYER